MSYFIDYYEILQVSPNASPEMVLAAYKHLMQIYQEGNGDEAKLKLLNEACEVLQNIESRRQYDQLYKAFKAGSANAPEAPQPSAARPDAATGESAKDSARHRTLKVVALLVCLAGLLVISWFAWGNRTSNLPAGNQTSNLNNAPKAVESERVFTNQDFEKLYSQFTLLDQKNFTLDKKPFVALAMASTYDNDGDFETRVKIAICCLKDDNWMETWQTPKDLDSQPASREDLRQNKEMFLPNLVVTSDNSTALVVANVLVGGAHGTDQVIAVTVNKDGQGSIKLFESAGIMTVEKQGNYVVVKGEGDFSIHKLYLENGVYKQKIIPLSQASSNTDIQAKFIIGVNDASIYAAENTNLTAKVGETIAFIPGDANTASHFDAGDIQIYCDAWNGPPLTLCEANRIKSGNSYKFDKPGEVNFILTYRDDGPELNPTFTVLVQ